MLKAFFYQGEKKALKEKQTPKEKPTLQEKQRITGEAIVQSRAIKTREKIFRAAISAYAEKGYHNTTVDEIAKKAEVSVGTAYRYFKDKKELLLAALEYGFTHIAEFADVSETDL